MFGSRWVITPLWLSGSWRSFLYSFSVYSCHLFLISSASVLTIFFLYWAHLCMKCSLGISNFLEEISSLSHSIDFLYFFALIAEGGFLFSSSSSFIFISQRLITLQYCSGFCHTLTWISHGFTCVPHPNPPSHLLLQPRCPSSDEWIRKLWYIFTMEYYSTIKKNSFESVLMRWMKLEPIIQSEVSQKDKDQYSILTHIYGI